MLRTASSRHRAEQFRAAGSPPRNPVGEEPLDLTLDSRPLQAARVVEPARQLQGLDQLELGRLNPYRVRA